MSRDLVVSWPSPAATWEEAAPVGNGRLGAMVFGGVRARVQVNDSTVWSGTPAGPAAALAAVVAGGAGPARLAAVRSALRSGDFRGAESLLMAFEGPYSQEYLPFADLWLTLPGAARFRGRSLNLDTGVVTELVVVSGVEVTRRTWASKPAGVLCVAVSADGPVDLSLSLTSPLRVVRRSGLALGVAVPVDGAPRHEPGVPAHRYASGPVDGYDPFAAVAPAVETDGVVEDGVVRGFRRLLVTLASSTSAAAHWPPAPGSTLRHGTDGSGASREDPLGAPGERPVWSAHERPELSVPPRRLDSGAGGQAPRSGRSREEQLAHAVSVAERAAARGADELLAEHEADFRGLLGRTAVRVGARRGGTVAVAEVLGGGDERLVATVMCQLGRYLLASASRPGGGPPANLQGIWNAEPRPAWSSNYTVNINTQMNYWPAEPAGLPECHLPLVDLLDRLAVTGADVARELYGARGWVTHHNTDPWGWALPVGMGHGNPSWAIWQLGGVWLVQHVWDHYEFTGDLGFLRDRGWPLLRGCAEFCLDWLVESADGHLDTIPATSPENLFVSAAGTRESLTYSPTMDSALIRALFERCRRTIELLGVDDEIDARIAAALPRLRPPLVTAGGWLGEWAEDLPEADPTHRHMSQMVTVHPLGQIDPEWTPDLAEAAGRLLDRRGAGAMGWSWAWKIALRARLGDGETAHALLREATRPFTGDTHVDAPVDGSRWGGLLPNLLSTHPPFQIDGNHGFTAAILEMLVQSHGGGIRLLPALPNAWPEGGVTGVRCRGGLAVDLDWAGGTLTSAVLRRLGGDPATVVGVRYGTRRTEVKLAVGQEIRLDATLGEAPC
ncbi:glycosyl hydrolase family 95 catalytic domain-containing protein [Actinophytocola sp.]|uniref:glycosyl hydrolase family 95 catalytic domain-containing protein n=1 Tax=Actinophytocola sp. TaxID=1872138 RepID=UPI002EDB6860